MITIEAQEGTVARIETGKGAARGIGIGRPLVVVIEAGKRIPALSETIRLPAVVEKAPSIRQHRGGGPMMCGNEARPHQQRLLRKMLKYVYCLTLKLLQHANVFQ